MCSDRLVPRVLERAEHARLVGRRILEQPERLVRVRRDDRGVERSPLAVVGTQLDAVRPTPQRARAVAEVQARPEPLGERRARTCRCRR